MRKLGEYATLISIGVVGLLYMLGIAFLVARLAPHGCGP